MKITVSNKIQIQGAPGKKLRLYDYVDAHVAKVLTKVLKRLQENFRNGKWENR